MKKTVYLLVFTLLLLGASYISYAQAPHFTGGHVQSMAVCMNADTTAIDALLAVGDTSTGHTVTWGVVTAAAHGTVHATDTATSTGGTLTPAGLTYMPATGYSGMDTFAVAFSDSGIADTTTIYVSVDTVRTSVGAITGPVSVCLHATITLADTVAGGVWSSRNTTASVGATGLVTGLRAGTDSILYTFTNACGSAGTTQTIIVNALPNAGRLLTPDSVCVGAGLALVHGGDAGGIWRSTNTVSATVNDTGLVTGIAPGTSRIAYLVTNGCGTDTAIAAVKVQTPVSAIIGDNTVCPFQMLTLLDLSAGGNWTSSSFLTAPVIGGIVIGVTPGTATISYSLHNACGTTTATLNVTVLTAAECPTAVNAVTNTKEELTIFPNPNNGAFTLNLSSAANEPVSVVITNIVGEKVREFTTVTNQASEITLDKPAGIYFIKAATSSGIYTAKLVVDR